MQEDKQSKEALDIGLLEFWFYLYAKTPSDTVKAFFPSFQSMKMLFIYRLSFIFLFSGNEAQSFYLISYGFHRKSFN